MIGVEGGKRVCYQQKEQKPSDRKETVAVSPTMSKFVRKKTEHIAATPCEPTVSRNQSVSRKRRSIRGKTFHGSFRVRKLMNNQNFSKNKRKRHPKNERMRRLDSLVSLGIPSLMSFNCFVIQEVCGRIRQGSKNSGTFSLVLLLWPRNFSKKKLIVSNKTSNFEFFHKGIKILDSAKSSSCCLSVHFITRKQ